MTCWPHPTTSMVANGHLNLGTKQVWASGMGWGREGDGSRELLGLSDLLSSTWPLSSWATVRSVNLKEGVIPLSSGKAFSQGAEFFQAGDIALPALRPWLPLQTKTWWGEMARICSQIRPGPGDMAEQSPRASRLRLPSSQHQPKHRWEKLIEINMWNWLLWISIIYYGH